ncbi:unnamed protein product [Clonostachys byssicola]|uniref:Uncharacterized protein n=1 Tax=Clonostachys byssicola TaxID=160290 RepID=A0A9N9XZT9_9HYPO|nr:unnamed protein product [Clonostachys byssicola]
MKSQLPLPATAERPAKLSWSSLVAENETAPISTSLPDPEPQVTVTGDEVLQAVNIHKKFRLPDLAPDIEVVGLPAFDDLTQYGITEQVQERLWAAEVSRLAEIVSGTAPLLFEGSADLAVDSQRAHELLASMADRVYQAMSIANYDAENMLAEEANTLCDVGKLRKNRATLEYIVDREEGGTGEKDANAPCPKHEDILKFVSYFSGVVARVLCTAADGKFMHLNILAQMAKLCTKLKVLTASLPEFAQISIDNGVPDQKIPVPLQYDLRGRQDGDNANNQGGQGPMSIPAAEAHSFAERMNPLLEDLRRLSGTEESPPDTTKTKKESVRSLYFLHCHMFRRGVLDLFRVLLLSMRGTNMLSSTPIDCYEMSSMVYVAGFERFRVLLYQDHNRKCFIGSSDRDEVNYARISYHLLDKTIRAMKDNTGAEPSTAAGESVGTIVSWTYVPAECEGGDTLRNPSPFNLKSMSQVITVLVPLILTNPTAVVDLDQTVGLIAFAEDSFNPRHRTIKLPTFGQYTAFCSLTTKEYVKMQEDLGPGAPRSLSNSLPRLNNLLRGQAITETSRTMSFPLGALSNDPNQSKAASSDDRTTRGQVERHQLELDKARTKMKAWVLEEKGVVVECKLYVYSLMVVCTLLVLGGVAVGAAVGDRISGVDPFNITTYCWVLAAFILLVAKSVRVHEWSWNDFLHRRVVCKSVSELSSITGINDQFIIAKLLQEERQSILQTRGPFNTIFRRRSEDGFSINCPISTWTMLLSGLIMIEVESITGHGLACLDLRQGTTYRFVDNQYVPNEKDNEKYIYCSRLYEENGKDKNQGPQRIRLSSGKGFIWHRTLGLYGDKNVEFI